VRALSMSAVHLHLAINHSPLYAELFALVLLLIGLPRRNRSLVTAGLVVAIIAAFCAIGADITGDAADEVIDNSPPIAGVEKTLIAPHNDAATYFLVVACIAGALAATSLIIGWRRGERLRWLDILITVTVLVSLLAAGRTALLGGRIHHPEVRAVTGA
jgi:hypothetical protein